MKRFTIICMTILFWVNLAYLQTASDAIRLRQNEIGFGARNLAMGGNGVALASDYSAIYWNPGGLASLKKSQFTAEFSHLNFKNDALFADAVSNSNESFSRLRSLGLAVPLPTTRGSLVFAFGYNYVRDFDEYLAFSGINFQSNGLEFELEDENGAYNWYAFDQDVEQTEEVIIEGGLRQWSFATAVALSPSFDLGASLNFWSGSEEYRLNFFQLDDANIYNNYPADFHSYKVNQFIDTDFKAFSLKLGGMFKLNRDMRLGVAVEFPTTFRIHEYYTDSDELEFDDGYIDAVEYEPGEWEYKVKTPYRFDAGFGVKTDRLSLTASVTYQDWTQTRFEKPDEFFYDEDFEQLFEENSFIRQDFRETLGYQLGGELALPGDALFLRGGYSVRPSPLKNATSDMDRQFYHGGIGFKVGRDVMLDATLVRGNWQRETEDSFTPGGTFEDITENRLFVGLRYSF